MTAIAAAAIGAGGAVLGGAFKFISGQNQINEGRRIAKNNPFVAETMPGEVRQATQLAERNYTNGMPGMTYAKQQITQNAGNAGAIAEKGASSGGDILDAANKIQGNANDATQQLALQAASYKSNALRGYEAALNTQAGWQDKLYQNNQLQPYLRAANTAASLEGAGHLNEAAGIDNAITGIQSGAQEFATAKYRNRLTDGLNTNQILALSALGR